MIVNPNSTTLARPDLGFVVAEYTNANCVYIADKILPWQPVSLRSDTFFKTKSDGYSTLPQAQRESNGGFNNVSRKLTTDSYAVLEYGLEEKIDAQDPSIYGNMIAGEQASIEFVQDHMLRVYEKQVQDLVINETNFAASGLTGLTISTPWDNAAATPAADVAACAENIRQQTGYAKQFLTLEISPYTYSKLPFVTDVITKLTISTQALGSTLSLQQLALYFGVKEVIVGTMSHNTANEGLTPVYADTWNNDYAFLFLKMEPGMQSVDKKAGLGLTFSWDYAAGIWLVETYTDDKIASNVGRVRNWRQPKLINSIFGNLLKNTKT